MPEQEQELQKLTIRTRPEGIVPVRLPACAITSTAHIGEYWVAHLTPAEAVEVKRQIEEKLAEVS